MEWQIRAEREMLRAFEEEEKSVPLYRYLKMHKFPPLETLNVLVYESKRTFPE
jgi:hypothetical protein